MRVASISVAVSGDGEDRMTPGLAEAIVGRFRRADAVRVLHRLAPSVDPDAWCRGVELEYTRARARKAEASGHDSTRAFALELLKTLQASGAWGCSLRLSIAAGALREEEADPEDLEAVERTAEAFRTAMTSMAPALMDPALAERPPALIPAWDAAAADHAASALGSVGVEWAKDVRRGGKRRAALGRPWALWVDSDHSSLCRAAHSLARVLWVLSIRPQIERERRAPPALAIDVHADVARIHSRSPLTLGKSDQVPRLEVPSTVDPSVVELVQRGGELFGSMTAHRLLRWELEEGHRRALEGVPDARILVVEDGWKGLASRLGMKRKYAPDLHAIVRAQAQVILHHPATGETGNLIAFHERPARGRRRSRLEIVLMPMLLPYYVNELKQLRGRRRNRARRLVPMLPIPPTVGRERDHGAQATLSMLLVAELRLHAPELATRGAVAIDEERLAELCEKASVPPRLLPRLMDRWVRDGDDGPAFLEARGPRMYTLGNAHGRARTFLEEAGRASVKAQATGRKKPGRKPLKARGARSPRRAKAGS